MMVGKMRYIWLYILLGQCFLFPSAGAICGSDYEIRFSLLQNWDKSITLVGNQVVKENIIVLTFRAHNI